MIACNSCIQGFSDPFKSISAPKKNMVFVSALHCSLKKEMSPTGVETNSLFFCREDYSALSTKSLIRSPRKLAISEHWWHSNNIHRLGGVVLASICTLLKFCRSPVFFVLIFWLQFALWIVKRKQGKDLQNRCFRHDICNSYAKGNKATRHQLPLKQHPQFVTYSSIA